MEVGNHFRRKGAAEHDRVVFARLTCGVAGLCLGRSHVPSRSSCLRRSEACYLLCLQARLVLSCYSPESSSGLIWCR